MKEICSQCGERLQKSVHDVTMTNRNYSSTVKDVAGLFCDNCHEIEFDETTDSAQRYAVAGDQLVLKIRAETAAALKAQRKKLKLTQAQASRLTGGGHIAFSRYETGTATPSPAVVNLFRLLDKHPEMLKELDFAS